MPVNKDLFKKIYEQITRYPETHNQTSWSERPEDVFVGEVGTGLPCGTTRCVAGWALHFYSPGQSIFKTALELDPECNQNPADPAAKLLGLSEFESEELFLHVDDAEAVDLVRRYAGIEDA